VIPATARRFALLVTLLAAAPARAQAPPLPGPPTPRVTLLPAPVLEPARSQHPEPPLTPDQSLRLRRATDLRLAGLPERSRDSLLALQRQVPGHPRILTELVRAHIAHSDWAAAERLARAERVARRDSLLAARELVLVYERLDRPREAMQVALEAWVAARTEGEWAGPAVVRHAARDPRATRELLARAVTAAGGREDLVRAQALTLVRLGDAGGGVRALAAHDRGQSRTPLRLRFAEDALQSGLAPDSLAAREAFLSVAGDEALDPTVRATVARRLWWLVQDTPLAGETAARLQRALATLPPERWGGELLVAVARVLRESGRGAEARALLARVPALEARLPELALERLLADLREGPPTRALAGLDSLAAVWPDARFMRAEARFFAGRADSALAAYRPIAEDAAHPLAGAALERVYLIEERPGEPALAVLGRIAWERWRGEPVRARALADSLVRSLPLRSAYHATAALELGTLQAATADLRAALITFTTLADSLPDDRLAPVARQRAGDTHLALGDAARALATYEAMLVRYPRAWNAPEVRRRVEQLRRERRS
jgi:tetratricopeptide (TPR) repeat protein